MPHKKKCEQCQAIFQPKRKTARFCLDCRKARRNSTKARKAEKKPLPRYHSPKLRCKSCNSPKLRCNGRRETATTIERYHRCKDCGFGFRTWENIQ